jgi:hypothetical protein
METDSHKSAPPATLVQWWENKAYLASENLTHRNIVRILAKCNRRGIVEDSDEHNARR